MTMEYRLRGALVKAEATPTVDALPLAANDTLLCRKIDLTPVEMTVVDREVIRSYFGNWAKLVGATFARVRLEVEMVGYGTAGPTTPPLALDACKRACGHSRTVNAGTSVVYSPVSSGATTASVYVYQAGTLHKILGCFGDQSAELAEDGTPIWVFDFLGIYVEPTDVALPAFAAPTTPDPVLCNSENTTAVSIRGFAAEVRTFSFRTGNAIERMALMGSSRRIRLNERKAAGSIELRATPVAMKNWWADITSASLGPMSIRHGTAVGNRVTIASTAGLQFTSPRFVEDRGFINLTMDLLFVPSGASGNNEYSITVS